MDAPAVPARDPIQQRLAERKNCAVVAAAAVAVAVAVVDGAAAVAEPHG